MRSLWRKKTLKPSEYPNRMLKALVKAYDDKRNRKAREEGLSFLDILRLAGMEVLYARYRISTEEGYDALGQLKKSNYIYESGSRDGPLYKPKPEGLLKGRFLNRSCLYRKVYHPIKGDVRTVVVTVITAVIISLLMNLLL